MIVLSGARIFDGENFLLDHAVVVEGERIAAIVPYAERPQGAARDLAGGLLAPGYIDVQVNGGGGVLFNEDPTPEAIARIAAAHRKHGTVGLLPTLVTDAPQVMTAAIAATREARRRTPATLGLHLEGPFLDPRRRGAHELKYIRDLAPGDVETIVDADCGAVMVTLAPNRVGAAGIAELARRGVLVSLGHSEASYEEARAAIQVGARAFTHLFNAMSASVGREPGMVGAALDAADGRRARSFRSAGPPRNARKWLPAARRWNARGLRSDDGRSSALRRQRRWGRSRRRARDGIAGSGDFSPARQRAWPHRAGPSREPRASRRRPAGARNLGRRPPDRRRLPA